MKRSILLLVLLIPFFAVKIYAEARGYYFARWNKSRIIVEDYQKINENLNTGDSIPENYMANYEKYGESLKELLKKHADYSEQKTEYYIEGFQPEFAVYTDLRPGDKLYLSTRDDLLEGKIDGYYIDLNDQIGGGAVFYATLKVQKQNMLEDYEILLCSSAPGMTKLNRRGITNKDMKNEFKNYILPQLIGLKTIGDDGTEIPLKKIKDEEIKVFQGNFTGKSDDEYLVGLTLRNDFTNFSSLIYVMDGDGNIIIEFAPLVKNNFYYSEIYAIVDINGDGVYELITNDGYYEGGAYNLQKFNGSSLEVKTSGFMFGV
jgi:hypothetical protein